MGHFGRRPITLVWYRIVLPGKAGLRGGAGCGGNFTPVKRRSHRGPAIPAIESPFYRLAPEWGDPARWRSSPPMASVIASQALISGAFSLTVQAIQLDYLPRLRVWHTSKHHHGQVYVPLVNWALMIGFRGPARARLPLVEHPGRGLRHRRSLATMVITASVLEKATSSSWQVNRWGWSLVRRRDDDPIADRRQPVPRRQRAEGPARRLVPAARGDFAARADGGRWQRGQRQLVWPPDLPGRAERRRRAFRSPTATWPGRRAAAVFLFRGSGAGNAGMAGEQPAATTRCSTNPCAPPWPSASPAAPGGGRRYPADGGDACRPQIARRRQAGRAASGCRCKSATSMAAPRRSTCPSRLARWWRSTAAAHPRHLPT